MKDHVHDPQTFLLHLASEAMLERGFRPEFGPEVLEEVNALSVHLPRPLDTAVEHDVEVGRFTALAHEHVPHLHPVVATRLDEPVEAAIGEVLEQVELPQHVPHAGVTRHSVPMY